jgi:hypothetical protein
VYLPEGRLSITENLHSALRQLRQTENHRILWVDAVCINQSDDVEKGRQVALMGEIYKRASSVLVWLAPASFETSKALEFLLALSKKSEDFGIKNSGGLPRMWLTLPKVTCSGSDTDRLLKTRFPHRSMFYSSDRGFGDSGSFRNQYWHSN